MRKEFNEKINENDYYTVAFPARQGINLQVKLGKILSPMANGILAALDTERDENQINAAFCISLGQALNNLSENEASTLLLNIFEHTTRNGKKIDSAEFDSAYQANYSELFKAVLFVLKSNFGSLKDFLPDTATTAQ